MPASPVVNHRRSGSLGVDGFVETRSRPARPVSARRNILKRPVSGEGSLFQRSLPKRSEDFRFVFVRTSCIGGATSISSSTCGASTGSPQRWRLKDAANGRLPTALSGHGQVCFSDARRPANCHTLRRSYAGAWETMPRRFHFGPPPPAPHPNRSGRAGPPGPDAQTSGHTPLPTCPNPPQCYFMRAQEAPRTPWRAFAPGKRPPREAGAESREKRCRPSNTR